MDLSVEILTVLLSAVSEDGGACVAQAGIAVSLSIAVESVSIKSSPRQTEASDWLREVN